MLTTVFAALQLKITMMALDKWVHSNETLLQSLEKELPEESTFYWLLISICAAIAWVVYITYYNARVVGIILTVIVNKLVKFGYVHIGEPKNTTLKCITDHKRT